MLQIIEHNPDDNDNNMQIAIRNNDMQLAALSDIAENQNDEVLSELSNHSHTLSIANSYKSDLNDLIAHLPENWIQLDFKNKKSCILSNIYSTCVTKAISHLEALQNCIENWIVNLEKAKALPHSASSAESTKRLLEYVRKRNSISYRSELKHFEAASKPANVFDKFNKEKSISFLVEYNAINQKKKLDLIVEERQDPIEDIKMGGILEELLLLLFRLELDRRRTEHLLNIEKANFTKLKSQIENISYKRAVDLPNKVQQEHDSCIMDITELNWHISFNIKSENKLKRKVEIEQKLYENLTAEINEIDDAVPLIEEKCQIEASLLQKILDAQADVDELLRKANEKHDITLEKSKQAHQKAEKERANIQADLAASRRELNKARKRLQEAEEQSQKNLKTLEESHVKMTDNSAQERKEMSRKGQLKQKNDKLNDQNNFIQTERVRIEKDITRVENENKELAAKTSDKKSKLNEELNILKENLRGKEDKLDKIVKKIKEKEIDLEEMDGHLISVQRNIEKESYNRDRILAERGDLESELQQAILSHQEAVRNHADVKNEQKKEKKKIENKEEALEKQLAELKKQIGEERSIAGTLIGRMKQDMEDYDKAKMEAQKKRTIFEGNKLELDKRLADLEAKVNEIESKKLVLDAYVTTLNAQLQQKKEAHVNLEMSMNNRIAELEPAHANNYIDFDKNKKKLEFMRSHTNEINIKMKEMLESINLMKKSIEKLNIETEELTDTHRELIIQLNIMMDLDKKSQKLLQDQNDRLFQSETSHKKHFDERKEYLERLKQQLEDNMQSNKLLASRYRDAKYDLYNYKLEMMSEIEKKLDIFISLKDKRQVKVLQERMHCALKDYYNYKIRNSESKYAQLNNKKEENADRIDSIEQMFHATLGHIARYLQSELDFSKLSKDAMNKVLKEELIEENELNETLKSHALSRVKTKETTAVSKKSVVFSNNLVDAI